MHEHYLDQVVPNIINLHPQIVAMAAEQKIIIVNWDGPSLTWTYKSGSVFAPELKLQVPQGYVDYLRKYLSDGATKAHRLLLALEYFGESNRPKAFRSFVEWLLSPGSAAPIQAYAEAFLHPKYVLEWESEDELADETDDELLEQWEYFMLHDVYEPMAQMVLRKVEAEKAASKQMEAKLSAQPQLPSISQYVAPPVIPQYVAPSFPPAIPLFQSVALPGSLGLSI